MAKISETELQKRLRKLEAAIEDPSDTVALTDDQYVLTENVIYVAYASALSNLVNGIISNQSDATDFQYSPYNVSGVLMAYRGYFSSTSVYASGDPTDYFWESTTGLSGFTSSERYYTTSTGLLSVLGNPTEPGDGITWTVITAGNAVPGTAIWVAERYTVSGVTSGWSINSVAAYIDTSLLIDDAVTVSKMADDAVGVAELSATGTASSSTFLRGDNSWVTPTDTEYTHPTNAGNKHIPTGGSSGEFLKYDSSGTAVWSVDNNDNTTYSIQDGELSQNNFTNADHTKLDGIEVNATADQTGAQIKTAYEAESDTNAFTDADHTKLDGIETSADVTDATNVTAAGALMDSEVTNLADVKAINQSLVSTASPTFVTLNATTVDLGDWTITETGGVLFFATGGTDKMKLDASGNLTCVGTVTESGSM